GSIWSFILPLVTLIGVGIWGLWYTGGGAEGKSLMDALADTDVAVALTWAALAMTVVGVGIGLLVGVGCKVIEERITGVYHSMMLGFVIIVLAWSIGLVTEVL